MNFKFESEKIGQGFHHVIGCDEVGRGCLAGPVVAAAVILDLSHLKKFKGVNDSKKLSEEQRKMFDGIIREHCLGWGIGIVEEKVIDNINIHHASLLAMRKAVEDLQKRVPSETKKYFLAVDGKFLIPNYPVQQQAVISGDAKILSIAAASVIAKVFRDNLMRELHTKHPEFGFSAHKGYATFHHREAIKKYGLTEHHRLSFCKQYVK